MNNVNGNPEPNLRDFLAGSLPAACTNAYFPGGTGRIDALFASSADCLQAPALTCVYSTPSHVSNACPAGSAVLSWDCGLQLSGSTIVLPPLSIQSGSCHTSWSTNGPSYEFPDITQLVGPPERVLELGNVLGKRLKEFLVVHPSTTLCAVFDDNPPYLCSRRVVRSAFDIAALTFSAAEGTFSLLSMGTAFALLLHRRRLPKRVVKSKSMSAPGALPDDEAAGHAV